MKSPPRLKIVPSPPKPPCVPLRFIPPATHHPCPQGTTDLISVTAHSSKSFLPQMARKYKYYFFWNNILLFGVGTPQACGSSPGSGSKPMPLQCQHQILNLLSPKRIPIIWASHSGSAVTSPTRIHENVGSIPSLTQWVNDPVLPWAVM